jgi:hypothetical protein
MMPPELWVSSQFSCSWSSKMGYSWALFSDDGGEGFVEAITGVGVLGALGVGVARSENRLAVVGTVTPSAVGGVGEPDGESTPSEKRKKLVGVGCGSVFSANSSLLGTQLLRIINKTKDNSIRKKLVIQVTFALLLHTFF